ncbi:hypothetical protein LVJ94_49525 [Pendulispora rubella]|uniref:Uncharacterized protein n=1 Tax=Pendulispora rubella TaxID=2741070 RepID=A0ABZ2L535_9BACT
MSADDDEKLVQALRERERQGATLLELVDLVHEWYFVPKYNRGILMMPFNNAFGLGPLDFSKVIFACQIFGNGASVGINETEVLFKKRLEEIRRG